jgi:hypothetical protein
VKVVVGVGDKSTRFVHAFVVVFVLVVLVGDEITTRGDAKDNGVTP